MEVGKKNKKFKPIIRNFRVTAEFMVDFVSLLLASKQVIKYPFTWFFITLYI